MQTSVRLEGLFERLGRFMGESLELICASLLLDTRQVGTKQRHVIAICVFLNVSQSIRVIKAVFYCSSTHNLEEFEWAGQRALWS